MSSRYFWVFVGLSTLAGVGFPIYQGLSTGGLLYYTNGIDEGSYLQYDYARYVFLQAGAGRMAQGFVLFAHKIGLSGGWINCLFDALVVPTFLLTVRAFALSQKPASDQLPCLAYTLPFCLLGLPMIVLTCNPIIAALSDGITHSTALSWITAPAVDSVPLLRTPEPQFSFCIAALAALFAKKIGSVWPLLLVAPLLYPFVGLPLFFVALAVAIDHQLQKAPSWLAPLGSFVVTGSGLAAYHYFLLPPLAASYIVPSRLPLISFTGILSLITYWQFKEQYPVSWRRALLFAALAPAALANTQIISGFFAQPNNYEQYTNVSILTVLLVAGLPHRRQLLIATSVSLALFFLSCLNSFFSNLGEMRRAPLRAELREALRSAPERVAAGNVHLATTLNLVYPQQHYTLLSYTRLYKTLPDTNLDEFLCGRNQLAQQGRMPQSIVQAVQVIEEGYRGGDQNYIMLTLGRVNFSPPQRELDRVPKNCPAKPLIIIP